MTIGNRHFGERRHAWAIDTGDGQLVASGLASDFPAIRTALWRTRPEALRAMLNLDIKGMRLVKVRVSYEVMS